MSKSLTTLLNLLINYWQVNFMASYQHTPAFSNDFLLLSIKSALFYFCLPFLVIISFTLGLTIGPFVSYPTRFKLIIGTFSHGTLWLCKHICQVDYQVLGLEHIPKDNRGYVILSKHQSSWETLFLQTLFDPNTVVLKKEALFIPFFGWGIALLNPIFINRKKGADAIKQILEKGTERLNRAEDILIFPEGTRVDVGKQAEFKKGGALLAVEAQADIIPIALNSGEYWNNKSWLILPGTITVVIGSVIHTQGKDWKQVNAQAAKWINAQVDLISKH